MQKERENQSSEEQINPTVQIIGKNRKVNLDKGKRLSDLIAATKSKFKEELKGFPFNNSTSIVLNGKVIKMNENGELEENPIITESSILSLMPHITGGTQ
ncbi:MAG: hypothetical protein Q7S43_03915 [bacterium]|nr:hypothetical protein [bacterium]